jgi:hypothetical protein
MFLKSISYSQFDGQPNEWKLDGLALGQVNLLVGKNAVGKSRAVSLIVTLARMLSAEIKPALASGNFHVVFDNDGTPIEYILNYTNSHVKHERLVINGKTYLDRGTGGVGTIIAEKINLDNPIDFQTPENELAVVARRDRIQHAYLEPLSEWGRSLRFYPFGTPLGRTTMTIVVKEPRFPLNENDADAVTPILRKGLNEHGAAFKDAIIRDMAAVGYPLEDIGTSPPTTVNLLSLPINAELVATYVRETGLSAITEQTEISQGMFRALAIIIHTNYAIMTRKPSCIVIDDIGEGLDFERSCSLIDLLMERTEQHAVQLIMSTNDRFIMNEVPLETWTILQRSPGRSTIYNYQNSKVYFDEFKYTGLNNFDFFATDFIHDVKTYDEAMSTSGNGEVTTE